MMMTTPESVILICGIPNESNNTVAGMLRSYIKGPYESCELLFWGPDSTNISFGFCEFTPSFTLNKNYMSKAEKQKEIKSFELSLTLVERMSLLKQCEHAVLNYRYSDKAAFESVLPSEPFLPFISWILEQIEHGYFAGEEKKENQTLHCCPTMVASLLDATTKQRFSKGFDDFDPLKVTTTDVVKLCVKNLEGKIIQKMDTYKKHERKQPAVKRQTDKGTNGNFFSFA